MKNVLWLSERPMDMQRVIALEQALGDAVCVTQHMTYIDKVEDIADDVWDADIVCADIPAYRMIELLAIAGERPVLIYVPDDGWYQVINLSLGAQKFCASRIEEWCTGMGNSND